LWSLQRQTEVPDTGGVSSADEMPPKLIALASCAVLIVVIVVVVGTLMLLHWRRRIRVALPRTHPPEISAMIMQPEHHPVEPTSDLFSPSPIGRLPHAEYPHCQRQ